MSARARVVGAYLLLRGLSLASFVVIAQIRGRGAWGQLTRWDSQWYAGIAEHGYGLTKHLADGRSLSDYAFFPLFPLLERVGADLFGLPVLVAGLVISVVSGVSAALAINAIATLVHDARVGLMSVVLWASLPISIVESAPYTESLFTALAAWALWATLQRRWITAGSLALVAGLTRPTGAAVVLAVIVACVVIGRARPRAIVGALLAPLGLLGYVAWVGEREGHLTGYFSVTRGWHNGFDGGAAFLRWIGSRPDIRGVVVLIALVALLALAFATRRQPLPLVVFTVALLVLALTTSGYFSSKPRYLLPAFPLLFPIADRLAGRERMTRAAVISVLTVCSCLFGAFWLMGSTPP